MNIVGIDPGKNGGITYMTPQGIRQFVVPKIAGTSLVDEAGLWDILKGFVASSHVFLEQVHALFGSSAKSTFNFGEICGLLRGMIIARGLSFTLVQPKTWQKEAFQGIPEQRKSKIAGKKGPIDTKKMALVAAKRLYPKIHCFATPTSRKAHDGLVDSLLIGDYGRAKNGATIERDYLPID